MKWRPCLMAAALLLSLGVAAHGREAKPPGPKAILREMVARYAGLSSYRDTGFVQTLAAGSPLANGPVRSAFLDASLRGEPLVSFKTYFARPRQFRFEWRSNASRESVVWSDGRRSYGWMPSGAFGDEGFTLDRSDELRYYIAEAQRSSSGAVFFVPSLLMKELDYGPPFGEMISSMTEPSVVKEEKFDGEVCYVISGNILGAPWLLWVGKESRLLRKTRTTYTSASFHELLEKGKTKVTLAEEVHRDIKVNERLPALTFRFKPRLGPRDIDLTR